MINKEKTRLSKLYILIVFALMALSTMIFGLSPIRACAQEYWDVASMRLPIRNMVATSAENIDGYVLIKHADGAYFISDGANKVVKYEDIAHDFEYNIAKIYYVQYDIGDGAWPNGAKHPTRIPANIGADFSAPVAPDGMEFVGWDTTVNHWTMVFKAVYAASKYEITWETNGGTMPAGALNEYTINTENYKLPEPQMEGYDFAGWYEDGSLLGDPIVTLEKGSMGDKTFYAKWNYSRVHNITYYAEFGEDPIGTMEARSANDLPEIEKDGYTLNGWKYISTKEEGTTLSSFASSIKADGPYAKDTTKSSSRINLTPENDEIASTTIQLNVANASVSASYTIKEDGVNYKSGNISNTKEPYIIDFEVTAGKTYSITYTLTVKKGASVSSAELSWSSITGKHDVKYVGERVTGYFMEDCSVVAVWNKAEVPVMKAGSAWYKSTTVNRSDIREIHIVDKYNPLGTVIDSWNADVNDEGLVRCYVEGSVLTIAGNKAGKILANTDCSYMFSTSDTASANGFKKLEKITGLDLLDTTNTTDMNHMFYYAGKVAPKFNIDVTTFKTTNVTNMSSMFEMAGYDAEKWSIGENLKWSTTKVINTSKMFMNAGYSSDKFELDMRKLVLSKVTDVANMFTGAGNNAAEENWLVKIADKTGALENKDTALYCASSSIYAVPCDGKKFVLNASIPVLASGSSWYKGETPRNIITEIKVVNSYTPIGVVTEGWNADAGDTGSIKCYIEGTKLTIAGNGTGNIRLQSSAAYLFSESVNPEEDGFINTGSITGLEILDTSETTNFLSAFRGAGKNVTGEFYIGGLNNWDTASVTNMERMFRYAGNSASDWSIGDIGGWNVAKVTSLAEFLYYSGRKASVWTIGDLRKWNTAAVTSMYAMFNKAGSEALVWEVGDLSGWDTARVTRMDYMFSEAGVNAKIWNVGDLGKWDTGKVTKMGHMFYCAGRNSETWFVGNLSNWDTKVVESTQNMFAYAGQKAANWSIGTLENWNVSLVSQMQYMFNYSGATSDSFLLDLSKWNTESLMDTSYMFNYAGANATAWSIGDLSEWKMRSVTSMSYMFNYAGNSSGDWDIGDIGKWNTESLTNAQNMFAYAGKNNTKIMMDLTSWDMSGVTSMESMFKGAWAAAPDSEWKVYIPETTGSQINDKGNWYGSSDEIKTTPCSGKTFKFEAPILAEKNTWYKGTTPRNTITEIHIKNTYTPVGVVTETWNADAKNTGSIKCYVEGTKLTIAGNGSGEVKANENSAYTFSVEESADTNGFINVAVIDGLEMLNTSNVKSMSSAFGRVGYATSDDFSISGLNAWDMRAVEDMSSMFAYAGYSVKKAWSLGDLSAWDTRSATNMEMMFGSAGRSAKTEWTIGELDNWNVSKVKNMRYMFNYAGYAATGTWTVGNLDDWDVSSVQNMEYMFSNSGYSAATWSIGDLSRWNTKLVENMEYMFYYSGTNAKDEWTIGSLDNWNVSRVKDMQYMFYRAGLKVAGTWTVGNLDDWDVSSVQNMRYMFCDTGSNAKVWSIGNLSKWNTGLVEDMQYMFYATGKIASSWDIGNISNWNTRSLKNTSSMFAYAGREVVSMTIDISKWDISGVTGMTNMFNVTGNQAADADWLVYIPEYTGTNKNNASNLYGSSATIKAAPCSGKTFKIAPIMAAGDSWWKGTTDRKGITEINIVNQYTPDGTESETWNADANNIGVIRCYIKGSTLVIAGNNTGSIKANEDSSYMFSNHENVNNGFTAVESVNGLEVLNTAGIVNAENMFAGLGSNAQAFTMDVGNFDTRNIKNASGMFMMVGNKAEIWEIGDVSEWNTENVKLFNGMFKNAGATTADWQIGNLQNWKTGSAIDMSLMFQNAGENASFWDIGDISNWDTKNVTSAYGMFYNAGGKSNNWNVGSLKNWDVSNISDVSFMFYNAGRNAGNINLDLSQWNLTNARSVGGMFDGFALNATKSNWIVAIPPKTGAITNTDKFWYIQSNEMYVTPCSGDKVFTIAPMLAAKDSWYGSGKVDKSSIKEIRIVNEYTPTGSEIDSWNADSEGSGKIKCYVTGISGRTLIIAGNGAGGILANTDSSYAFSASNAVTYTEGFANVESIEGLEILNMSGVTDTSHMFDAFGYNVTEQVNFEGYKNWDMKSVESADGMFNLFAHSSLNSVSLDMSGWEIENIKSTSNMFNGIGHDAKTINLNLDGWNTKNLVNAEQMFISAGYSANIFSINGLSNWDVSSLKNANRMFRDTGYSTTEFILDLSGWNLKSANKMDNMFVGAGNNASTNRWVVTIAPYTGALSNNETRLYGETENVHESPEGAKKFTLTPTLAIGSTWYRGTTRKDVITKINITKKYTPMNTPDEEWNADDKDVGSVKCYVEGTTLTISGNGAERIRANENSGHLFSESNSSGIYFSNVKEITGLKLLDVSNVTNMEYAFYNVGSSVSDNFRISGIDGWNTANVQNFDYAFRYAGKLAKSFNIGKLDNWNLSNAQTLNYMFGGAGQNEIGVWTVGDLSEWNVRHVTSMTGMFANTGERAAEWKTGDIGRWSVGNVKTMNQMFFSAGSSAETWSPFVLNNWNTESVTNMSQMFYGAGASAKVWSIGNALKWNTKKTTNMSSMFNGAGAAASGVVMDLSAWDLGSATSATSLSSMFANAWNGASASRWVIVIPGITYVGTKQISNESTKWFGSTSSVYASPCAGGKQFTIKVPVLAERDTWYKGTTNKNTITKINIVDSYTPTNSEKESWNADEDGNGNIKCYINGTTLIIVGNGSGSIAANADSSLMFSTDGIDYASDTTNGFIKVASVTGLDLLDTSNVYSLEKAFYGLGKMATTFSMDISTLDVANVTTFKEMLAYCGANATTWGIGDISKWNTKQVTTTWKTFMKAGKESAEFALNLSEWNLENVVNADLMFYDAGSNAAMWLVMIPEMTGTIKNEKEKWFCENGYAVPATEREFSLATHYPMLAPSNTWYKGSMNRDTFTEINIVDSYTPTGTVAQQWNADVDDSGSIKCYVEDTILTIAGNGTGKIKANPDSSMAFSNGTPDNAQFLPSNAFFNVASINGLDILDTSSVTNMYGMFYALGATAKVTSFSAVDLDIADFDTSNVTDMSWMFAWSGHDASAMCTFGYFGRWNTSKVKSTKGMFLGTGQLSVLQFGIYGLEEWDVSSLEDTSEMFSGAGWSATVCEPLDLSRWNTKSLKNARATFYGIFHGAGKVELNLSSWNLTTVTNTSEMFMNAGISASDANWLVYIPKKTGSLTNTTGAWYGGSSSIVAAPCSGRTFKIKA